MSVFEGLRHNQRWRVNMDVARRILGHKDVGCSSLDVVIMVRLKERARWEYIPAIRYQRNVRE